jgi:SAM-dependent methyltransferase
MPFGRAIIRSMTLKGAISIARRLALGRPWERRALLFAIGMKLRRVDLDPVNAADLGLAPDRSNSYSNSGGPALRVIMRQIEIAPGEAALDLGCGKGGAMLTLARYPFERVDGIEISPELAGIARANLRRLRISNSQVFCCDAGQFRDLDRYTFLYLYNPFPEAAMRDVACNLAASLQRRARRVRVLYKNPLWHDALTSIGFHSLREFHHDYLPFRLYSTRPTG